MRTRNAQTCFRLAVTLLCLWSFVVQAFIAQTHFHAPAGAVQAAPAFLAAADAVGSAPLLGPDQFRHGTGGEPACLLCKIALHGGGAALPPNLPAFASLDSSRIKPAEAFQILASSASSYHWKSRAPPSA